MDRSRAYKFCPRCGKAIEKKALNLLSCPNCSFNYYVNPNPCTANILENSSGEILLVERSRDPKKGFWDLPGGFVDIKETLEESAKREVKEELGVDVPDLEYLGSYTDGYLFQGIDLDCITAVFFTKISGQNIKVGDDVSGFKFFKKSEIPWDKIAFESMTRALRDYLKSH